jgi:hypothetical protein
MNRISIECSDVDYEKLFDQICLMFEAFDNEYKMELNVEKVKKRIKN